ncbi:hypothetical protein Z945_944 [Sulfitobacter noctilucae]|nr:hypothetical protein Z945_944 [Sulfitobacter noctilucae]
MTRGRASAVPHRDRAPENRADRTAHYHDSDGRFMRLMLR